ncbi:MAG: hypothetical protein ACK5S6_04320 [bacterium]
MGQLADHGSGVGGFGVPCGDGDAMASRVNFSDKAIDELMDAMLYSPRDPIETAGEMFSRWWSNNRNDYLHIGRNKCRDYYMTLARRIQREFISSRKGRCGKCGAKILTLRCRACDLLEDMRCERSGLHRVV